MQLKRSLSVLSFAFVVVLCLAAQGQQDPSRTNGTAFSMPACNETTEKYHWNVATKVWECKPDAGGGGAPAASPVFMNGAPAYGAWTAYVDYTKVSGLYVPYSLSTTTLSVGISTADNSVNKYSWCVFNASGTLVASTAPASYTTTGSKSVAWTQGTVTQAPGKYYFGFTGNGSVLSMYASTMTLNFLANANISTGSLNGACPASITPPADDVGLFAPTVVFR
jgi:hypothetical protein